MTALYRQSDFSNMDDNSNKALFMQMLNSTIEGIILHKDGIGIEVNDPLLKLFGYEKDELIGANLAELLPAPHEVSKVSQIVESGQDITYTAMAKRKNGTEFYAEVSGKNIKINGETYRIASVRDVTEKYEAENKLVESEKKYKSLIKALADIVMVVDFEGLLIYANDQLKEQTGFDVSEITFGKYNPLIFPSDNKVFNYFMDIAKENKKEKHKSFELRFISNSGEINWYSTILSNIEFEGKPAIQIVSRNITESKLAEIELKRNKERLQDLVSERTREINQLNKDLLHSNSELTKLNSEISRQNIDLKTLLSQLKSTQRQLVDTEKLASVGKLTSGLAHELNNPINWIGGVIKPMQMNLDELRELIKDSEGSEIFEELEELFKNIKRGTEKISTIIKTLSDITPRGDLDKKETLNLEELIYSNISSMESRFPEITFEYNVPEKLYLFANPLDIQQVFFNVIKNAAEAVENSAGAVRIDVKVDNDGIKGTVIDNGPGIDDKIQQDIYEPFFSTRKEGKYLGLGLYIVKSIVSKYNGGVFVNSRIGQGTTFTFTIPGCLDKNSRN